MASRWSCASSRVASGLTFLSAMRAAPRETGSPLPMSAITVMALSLGRLAGDAGILGGRAVASLGRAQTLDRVRPLGLQAVLLALGCDRLLDDRLGRHPVAVHLGLVVEVTVIFRRKVDLLREHLADVGLVLLEADRVVDRLRQQFLRLAPHDVAQHVAGDA